MPLRKGEKWSWCACMYKMCVLRGAIKPWRRWLCIALGSNKCEHPVESGSHKRQPENSKHMIINMREKINAHLTLGIQMDECILGPGSVEPSVYIYLRMCT